MGKHYRLNRNIEAEQVRLLNNEDKQLGIFTKDESLQKAKELGVDLVEIAPKAKPPVCKLIDFKKFKYQEKKREREIRRKAKTVDLKQIRLRPFIGKHDFRVRAQKAKEFLGKGDRVKIIVQFFGRQITHKEFGFKIIDQLLEELKDKAYREGEPRFQGKRLIAYFSPKAKKEQKNAKNEDKKGSN